MSCVDRHPVSLHRTGSMLHHRFPNGFTERFMDETDREVSTLTDRAFRSLCVGDEAVYNDSPFSCHKPLAEEPARTSSSSKKTGHQNDGSKAASTLLKDFSASEGNCGGMLIQNGVAKGSNGDSWDKSALLSIQKELSEFSGDCHNNLAAGHLNKDNNHHRHSSGGSKTGKSSKTKHGKSNAKLRKLNIKNLFLHSEFSPFQSWRDLNRFSFGQENIVASILPVDSLPRWYDSLIYKELTEGRIIETLHSDETQERALESKRTPPPPPPPPPRPSQSVTRPPPPKVPPKPKAATIEMRCSSEAGEGSAPWRRNRVRANSAASVSKHNLFPPHDSKKVEVSPLPGVKEGRSVEVKAVEEVSSLSSTPFSICQLMTPIIPSRQATDTSEIFSPSALDLPLRPDSEARLALEPTIKRETYKSIASSLLFNIKDNRKRVKSRYSPTKFKVLDVENRGTQSPRLEQFMKYTQAGSDGYASGLSTPTVLKDGKPVNSPVPDLANAQTVGLCKALESHRPISDDYLISNLLQTKREAAGSRSLSDENGLYGGSPFAHSKLNKSPMANKQNYPSLTLYKKSCPVDAEMKSLTVPVSAHTQNKALSPNVPETQGNSPNVRDNEGSPNVPDNKRHSSNVSDDNGRSPNCQEVPKRPVKDIVDSKEKHFSSEPLSTKDVVRAARKAINAAKTKAFSSNMSENAKKQLQDIVELSEKDASEAEAKTKESRQKNTSAFDEHIYQLPNSTGASEELSVHQNPNVRREPPEVPTQWAIKADIQTAKDKQHDIESRLTNGNSREDLLLAKEKEPLKKQGRFKHVFSAQQNNYIKNQRGVMTEESEGDESNEESEPVMVTMVDKHPKMTCPGEITESEQIISDLQDLKDLERARLSDLVFKDNDNKSRIGSNSIDEETKAKNDLISRELRNIKKGMMSIKGNTFARREAFAKKEEEQRKHDIFTKIDSNVIVNRALINDNYDKAKMALEEVIADRLKKKSENKGGETNPWGAGRVVPEPHASRGQPSTQTSWPSGTSTEDLRERLGELKDYNHIKHILSQPEVIPGNSHRSGVRVALPGMDRVNDELNKLLVLKSKSFQERQNNRGASEKGILVGRPEGTEVKTKDTEKNGDRVKADSGLDPEKEEVPPVPPRRKGSIRSQGSSTKDSESAEEVTEQTKGRASEKVGEENETNAKEADRAEGKASAKEESGTNGVNDSQMGSKETPHMALSEKRGNDVKSTNSETILSLTKAENNGQEKRKVKRKAPLKPEHYNTADAPNQENREEDKSVMATERETQNLVNEELEKTNSDNTKMEEDPLHDKTRQFVSPGLLLNGISVNQNPPDQSSLSSKSSYFSVESTLQRSKENESNHESNLFHSLENLIAETEEVKDIADVKEESADTQEKRKENSEGKSEMEYYSVSDHESEPELEIRQAVSPLKGKVTSQKESGGKKDREADNVDRAYSSTDHSDSSTPMSPSNTLSPPLGIPALFKIKDNTLKNVKIAMHRTISDIIQPWSPRESLSGSERGEEPHCVKESLGVPLPLLSTLDKELQLIEVSITTPSPLSLSNLPSERSSRGSNGAFLTAPQEEDRSSGLSPLSAGFASSATSTGDVADEPLDNTDGSKVPSERSGSACSGYESHGLPKPPVVLPKSERALLKAMKLTNRRIQKEEAKNKPSSRSQSSSKHKGEKHRSDKSESKSSAGSSEKPQGLNEKHQGEPRNDRVGYKGEKSSQKRSELDNQVGIKDPPPMEIARHSSRHTDRLPAAASERHGRNSKKHRGEKPEHRHYSTDRVISDVPVYKAHVDEGLVSTKQHQRSHSIDAHAGDKAARRPSNEPLDHRSQHIERSIMDELQQRGRARDRHASRDIKRSLSIDSYGSESKELPSLPSLSRQSSYTGQLSRQSSMEPTIVTQSFPMTQRKLLQDPDSGQYFVVDMPVQVKTKTFYDPETGNYVQLPVQPPEGARSLASKMEVVNSPMVLYHGFVPVPVSSLAQKSAVQSSPMGQEEFEQRLMERNRQKHSKEGHPYLEPVYAHKDHVLGEFLGTDELDCEG